jgi:hypothetical protein
MNLGFYSVRFDLWISMLIDMLICLSRVFVVRDSTVTLRSQAVMKFFIDDLPVRVWPFVLQFPALRYHT